MSIKNICVFCGSSLGKESIYEETAINLGNFLAQNQYRLIYGGGNVGLMGTIADACLNSGGSVVGVIPQFLKAREIAHQNLTGLITVKTMHERKMKMAALAEAFIIMPGGIGTLEEFFEVFTWSHLGLHQKPIAVLNVNGFYDKLLDFIDFTFEQGFIKESVKNILISENNVSSLMEAIQDYQAPHFVKWIDKQQT